MLVNATGSHSYTYDDIYQLTDVNYPAGYSFSNDTTFNYDAASNRTSVIESGTTTYSANNLNQYDSVGGIYYDYEGNGSITYDGVAFYGYDSEHRLILATNASDSTGGVLNAALDNYDLTFTRGGDANWAPVRPDCNDPNYGGLDSAKSGVISTSQSTYFEAVVQGKGTVKFYYKKDAGTNDAFRFRVDGSTKTSTYNSARPWTYFGYNITTTGSHTLRWQYEKGASGVSDETGAWVDRVEWIPEASTANPSIAEAVDSTLTYSTGGASSWYGQTSKTYYGGDAAGHYGIDDAQETWMQTTYTASAGDKISFFWKVSSESSCDYLEFYIDAVRQDRISGDIDWTKKSYSLSAGSRTLKWRYVKNSSSYDGDDRGWVDGIVVGTDEPLYRPPGALAEATDCDLPFTTSGYMPWFVGSGSYEEYYLDGDSAHAGQFSDGNDACMQTIVESSSSETLKFYWKVSSEQNGDYLQFYIDETLQHQISGEVDWALKTYSLSAGIHSLKWRYVKDGSTSSGDDTAWVDFIQWTGPSPARDPNSWQQIDYKYDVIGRRTEKKVDGYTTRFVRDGSGSVLAEYDGNNNLLRKYVAGPGGPVCMIEEAQSETYYYHYDGSGNVIALSDSAGDTVQTYEYSVFGRVAAEDANHPNPYMFGGMRFEAETGLYFTGGPVYNPNIGRTLQQNYGIHWDLYSAVVRPIPREPETTTVYVPIDAVADKPGDSPYWDIWGWLNNIGFFDHYGEWNLQDVSIVGNDYKVILETRAEPDDIVKPQFSFAIWRPGGGLTGEVDFENGDKVTVTILPDRLGRRLVRLDDRTLHRLLKPSLDWVDKTAAVINTGKDLGNPAAGVGPGNSPEFIIQTVTLALWDSIFHHMGGNYYYQGMTFDYTEVNYFMGGYMVAQFGWPRSWGWAGALLYKAGHGHTPWAPRDRRL